MGVDEFDDDMDEGLGRLDREKEMERCAEAVVCMRDWDGRKMKDLAWCLTYAASEPSFPSAHTSTSTSLLSSPTLPAQSPPPDGGNGDSDGGTRSAGGHADVALFTKQLVDAFGRFYGEEMRAEFVGYVREYGRETFVGWWESVSPRFPS